MAYSELCCSLKRVRKTSCGYVVTHAMNFAKEAAAKTLPPEGEASFGAPPTAAFDAACVIDRARKFS